MNHRRFSLRVAVQEQTPGNPLEDTQELWTEKTQLWADIRPVSGNEYGHADQIVTDATHDITTRHYKNATPRSRLLLNGRAFEVIIVLNDNERNRWTVWRCKEVV